MNPRDKLFHISLKPKGKWTVFPGYWMFRPGKHLSVQSQQLKH